MLKKKKDGKEKKKKKTSTALAEGPLVLGLRGPESQRLAADSEDVRTHQWDQKTAAASTDRSLFVCFLTMAALCRTEAQMKIYPALFHTILGRNSK